MRNYMWMCDCSIKSRNPKDHVTSCKFRTFHAKQEAKEEAAKKAKEAENAKK